MNSVGRFLALGVGVLLTGGNVLASELDQAPVSVYREEPRSYAGASLVQFNLESSLIDQQPGGLMVRMGGYLDDHFGAEVRMGAGFWHEAQRDGLPATVKKVVMDVDYVAGAYFTGRWGYRIPYVSDLPIIRDLVKQYYVDAQLGMAAVGVSAEAESFTNVSTDESWDGVNPSWGVGLGADITVPYFRVPGAVGLQYMNYGTLEDVPTTGDDLDMGSLEASLQLFF